MTAQSKERRDKLLLEIYSQTSSHLNRHILLTWQSIGVVAGALAVFLIGDKFPSSPADERLDFVIALVVILCAWCIAHIFDANNWFDRNLHIIRNIEADFLDRSDLAAIHFFFERHRRESPDHHTLIMHFRIQLYMVALLALLIVAFHLYQRGWPSDRSDWTKGLPYAAALYALVSCIHVWRNRKSDYDDLLKGSPGKRFEDAPTGDVGSSARHTQS